MDLQPGRTVALPWHNNPYFAIPIRPKAEHDIIVWEHTKTGDYIVKHGYAGLVKTREVIEGLEIYSLM